MMAKQQGERKLVVGFLVLVTGLRGGAEPGVEVKQQMGTGGQYPQAMEGGREKGELDKVRGVCRLPRWHIIEVSRLPVLGA